MKKRLRRKFRVGEFTEYGFMVTFRLQPPAEEAAVSRLLGAFIDQVEHLGLGRFGVSRPEGTFEFQLVPARPKVNAVEEHRQSMQVWLTENPAVTDITVGPLVDANAPAY